MSENVGVSLRSHSSGLHQSSCACDLGALPQQLMLQEKHAEVDRSADGWHPSLYALHMHGIRVKRRRYPVETLHHLSEWWHALRQIIPSLCSPPCCILSIRYRASLSV